MEMRSTILAAKRVARALAAWSPAIVVLAMLAPLRTSMPYHDSWAFVKQYIAWQEGNYTWAEFWAPHNNHPIAVGKAIYFAVLQWAGGDVSLLPLVSWVLSLVLSLALISVIRPRLKHLPWQGAGVVFLLNLSIFSAAQGHTWVWDFVFQNFIPGTCLALAIWVFDRSWPLAARLSSALLLSAVATFSFGSGFIIGFLLTPCVGLASSEIQKKGRWWWVLGWLAAVTIVAWMALSWLAPAGVGQSSSGERLGNLFSQPILSAQYILMLLGLTLGLGTDADPYVWCAVFGAALIAASAGSLWWLWTRRRAIFWKEALSPLILLSWALINSGLICLARMNGSLGTAYAHRYGTFSLFFVVGTVWLVSLVAEHRREEPRSGGYGQGLLPVAVTILLVGHFFSWIEGWRQMQVESLRMRQEKAILSIAPAVTPTEEQYWWFQKQGDTVEWARWLESHDHLGKMRFAENPAVASFQRRSMELGGKGVSWSASRSETGEWMIGGICGSERGLLKLPDLVLLSAEGDGKPETFIALARPRLPDDFFNREFRRRQYSEHYLAWETRATVDKFPSAGDITLRAYTYDVDSGRIRAMAGKVVIPSAMR